MHIRWIFFYFFLCSFFLFLFFNKHVSQTGEVRVKQATFRCACCRRILPRDSRVKNQRYCGAKACQRARKSKWQREKLELDPDDRANKRESQRVWQGRNSSYWQQYRKKNPDYCEHNRQLQRARDRARRCMAATETNLAKMDTLGRIFHNTSMTYFISASQGNLAKMDAIPVKIIPITPG